MKRSELTVGAELYYAKPYEWTNNRLGDRVVVVATEPYHQSRPEWSMRLHAPTQVKTGPGVLVDRYVLDIDRKPVRTVVPLGHLRGPYAEVKAEVEKRAAENRKAADAEREQRDRYADTVRAIVARAKRAGFDVWHGISGTGDYHTVTMTPETLDRMLTAIEKGNDRADER